MEQASLSQTLGLLTLAVMLSVFFFPFIGRTYFQVQGRGRGQSSPRVTGRRWRLSVIRASRGVFSRERAIHWSTVMYYNDHSSKYMQLNTRLIGVRGVGVRWDGGGVKLGGEKINMFGEGGGKKGLKMM